jgi:hypothetical protein
MKSLGGCNVNPISKRSDNESCTVSEVLITIVESGICNSDDEIFLITIKNTLKLSLPIKIINPANIQVGKIIEDISRVSIHRNQTHDLLSNWFCEITLDHQNKAFQGINLIIICFSNSSWIRCTVPETLFAFNDP